MTQNEILAELALYTADLDRLLEDSELDDFDLIRNIHGVSPVAELDGDEVGVLVAKVAEIKRRR